MDNIVDKRTGQTGILKTEETERPVPVNSEITDAFSELWRYVCSSLETYSNVHRGSGHNSIVTTKLYEQSREIILEYLGLDKNRYVVIFCPPGRADMLTKLLRPGCYSIVSAGETGLPLGLRALAVRRKNLPKGAPFQAGGGTTRLVAPGWVIWANAPDRFEAGTPPIVNAIAFAKALQLIKCFGDDAFRIPDAEKQNPSDILYKDDLEIFSGKQLLEELRKTLIGRNVIVQTTEGPRQYINLDNGASTRTFSPVWNAFRQTLRQPEKVQQEIIEEVRSICAETLGAPSAEYDIIFTSNTTEAINLAAESLSREKVLDTETVVLNTMLEHNSNDLPWRMFPNLALERLNVDNEGFVGLNELESTLRAYNREGKHGRKRISLVAVSGASNVLGTFNDLGNISSVVHAYGARLLVDAAQLVAHRKVDAEKCGIDYLAFSAHKVYAPFGTGVLIARKGLLGFNNQEMEMIKSSGDENAGGIAALGKSLLLLKRIGFDVIYEEEKTLTARVLRGMEHIPGLTVYGISSPDSPRFECKGGVIVFSLKNIWPQKLAKALSEKSGIGVRYGCHCAHLLVKRILNVSRFLEQFQGLMLTLLPKVTPPGIVRVSLGIENTGDDIDIFLKEMGKIAGKH